MRSNSTNIAQKINRYRRRYYLRLLTKGLLLGAGIVISIFLFVTFLEAVFRFSSAIRAILLFTLIGSLIFVFIRYLGEPILVMLKLRKGMSEKDAARQIGRFFPQVSDKLLNLLQLQESTQASSTLVQAGISQKLENVGAIEFGSAIRFSDNKPYVKYAVVPLAVLLTVAVISPSLLPDTSRRIVNFNTEFVPEAPFDFIIGNETLRAFRNEDFELSFRLEGSSIPEHAYLIDKDRKIKLFPDAGGVYRYTYPKIQSDRQFAIEAAGFTSTSWNVDVVDRPDLLGFDVALNYPNYLGRKNERRENAGNLRVPEGTRVTWLFNTQSTDSLALLFGEDAFSVPLMEGSESVYRYEQQLEESKAYKIFLSNTFGTNRDPIVLIPDEYPSIDLEIYRDTLRYDFIAFRGDLSDDYGISRATLYFRNASVDDDGEYRRKEITVSREPNQRFFHQWDLDSLDRIPGTELSFFIRAWDNDGVNGTKSRKTATYTWKIPGDEEIDEALERIAEKTSNSLDKTMKQAREMEEKVKAAEERLRGKRELNFQDEMFMKELLEKRKELEEAIEELKEQNRESLSQRDRFNKDQNEQLRDKAEQLQQLMEELLDEETRKLYEELQKLMEEQRDVDDFRDALEKLNRKENNLSKELERTLELFKRLKLEQKTNERLQELQKQMEEQQELLEKTKDEAEAEDSRDDEQKNGEQSVDEKEQQEQKDGDDSGKDEQNESGEEQNSEDEQSESSKDGNKQNQELSEQQEELQKKFEELKEEIKDIEELNQDLKRPQSLPDTQEEQQEISESQEQSKESLEQNQKNQSQRSQQKAVEQMKQMQQKMQQMQSSMEMEVMMENMDDLRDIMHNLITLSFDQEELIDEFQEVQQSDPRFVTIGQEQLKIRDDAQIVEDSLLALAERVFQLQAFVTREVENMNYHLDKSLDGIKERKKPVATAEQQFAMTAMNNLALLLDDVMEQMQNSMMQQGNPSGQKQPMPSLSQMQQQLNQQIQDLKNSGKQGRELSEELARLAAEQERIRQAFQEMQQKFKQDNGGQKPGQGIPEQMEETEVDLVNKRLTQEMIERQKDILTRMLESEEALREQDKDEERKGGTAKEYDNVRPKAFEEYFKLREQEIELLRTLPPKLYPYYKKEVNEYFKRLGKTGN